MAPTKNLTGRQIFDLLKDDLQKVEEEFCQQTVSSVPAITEIGQYLQEGGGKRLRPTLVLLASSAQDARLFNELQPWLLGVNVAGVFVLLASGISSMILCASACSCFR